MPAIRPSCVAGKLPFEQAPQDDRGLADLHLALYNEVVVFDHATKLAYVIAWVRVVVRSLVERVAIQSSMRLTAIAASVVGHQHFVWLGKLLCLPRPCCIISAAVAYRCDLSGQRVMA
jgi:hypothetical protein